MGFPVYMDDFDEGIEEMKKPPGHKTKVKGIVDKMKSTKRKTSSIKRNKALVSFSDAAEKKCWIIATESKTEGTHITAAVGRRVLCSYLGVSKPGHKTTVDTDKS